jgi:LppX_LprAFG lipoprotein
MARILALFAALALLAAGCGGDDGPSSKESADAQALLEKAFSKQVDSAELKLDLKADLEGLDQLKGPISLSISGPFKSSGDDQLPVLDWDVKVKLGGQTIDAGVVVTKDNAYVSLRGQNYEVGEQVFDQLQTSFARQQKQSGGQQSLKQFGIDPTDWLKDPKVEDGEDIGGDATRKVSGDVDAKKVVQDVLGALRSPALRRQLESQGQTIPEVDESAVDQVTDAIKEVRFEVNVDENDVARRIFAEAEFDVPDDADLGALEGGEVSFGFVLEKVGIEPEIEAPANPQPLSLLLGQFGLGGGSAIPQQQ